MNKQTVQQQQLNIWHEFDGKGDTSIEVLEQLCRQYSSEFGVPVIPKVMNISILTAGLQQVKTAGAGPQMALVPADMAGYGEAAMYSEIPEKFWSMSGSTDKDIRYSMRSSDRQYGIPILKGNHLVLYCNSEIYPEAPASWEAIEQQAEELMAKGIVPVASDLADPYCFIPFLTAFGGWPLKEGNLICQLRKWKQPCGLFSGKLPKGCLAVFTVQLNSLTVLSPERLVPSFAGNGFTII